MPNTKSAIRRVRRVKRQTSVNRLRKSRYRSAVKEMEQIISSKKKDQISWKLILFDKVWRTTQDIY